MVTGLEDVDHVSALKKQLLDLEEKSNLLAAHLQHTKFLASRAIHTTAELQAQNVELKQELLSISGEFDLHKEKCVETLSEYESKRIKDGEAMAALQLELKDMDKTIGELRSQLATQAKSQDKSKEVEAIKTQLDKAKEEKALLIKKINDITSSSIASKSVRDKLIMETEMELKSTNDALTVATRQLANLQGTSEKERVALQAQFAATHQTQLDKAKEEKALLIKKINDITSSSIASKSVRDKLIMETEMELKSTNDALTVATRQLANLQGTSEKERVALQAQFAATHQTQLDKAKEEKALLIKKINDITSSSIASKSVRDKLIMETEMELTVVTKQLASSKKQQESSAVTIAVLETTVSALEATIAAFEVNQGGEKAASEESEALVAMTQRCKGLTDTITTTREECQGLNEQLLTLTVDSQQYKTTTEETIVAQEREVRELKSQLVRIIDKSRQRISHLEGMMNTISDTL